MTPKFVHASGLMPGAGLLRRQSIAARDDRLRSLDEALELKEGIPGAQWVIIEASGHMVPLEAPEAVAGAIRAWRPT